MPNHDGGECFASGLILGIEAPELGTVEVQHSDHGSVSKQRNNEFGPGGGIAGDVTRECVHVRHQDRPALPRGGTADTLTRSDACARWAALERTDHQRIVTQKVKPGPVKVW